MGKMLLTEIEKLIASKDMDAKDKDIVIKLNLEPKIAQQIKEARFIMVDNKEFISKEKAISLVKELQANLNAK